MLGQASQFGHLYMVAIWQPCTIFVRVAPLGLAISNPLPLNLHTFHDSTHRFPWLSESHRFLNAKID